jgi:predicted  nucleic acid-binding Zn-ribbon protein
MFGKPTGMKRIDQLVGQLLTIKADLNQGIEEIDDVLDENSKIQDTIKAANRLLGAKRTQATNLAKNIEELLS